MRLPWTSTPYSRNLSVAKVVVAKQRGQISSARPVLEQLRCTGMYLSDRVLDAALRLVGE